MTPLFDQPTLFIGEAPALIAIVMRRSPDDATFAECGARVREVASRQARFNVLILIPRFDGQAKASRTSQRAFAELLGELHQQVVGTSITITVPGAKGSLVRMTINAVLLLGKMRNPVQLHRTLTATVKWMRSLPGQVQEILGGTQLEQELRLLPE